jgi:large subunit ribosomal protein L4e
LPTAKITNPDVTRLINSDEIQSIVRPANQKHQKRPWTQKKNPLVNKAVLFRLNPYAKTLRRQELREFVLDPITLQTSLMIVIVKQERRKKLDAKKPKTPKAAGEAFLSTLFAP